MIRKRELVKTVKLLLYGRTVIFAEGLELTYSYASDDWYNIIDIKGDFEITKITANFSNGVKLDNIYDKQKNAFKSRSCDATFYITTKDEMTEMYAATYKLEIPSAHLQCLKLNHYFKGEIVLPGHDEFKFIYYVNKFSADHLTKNDIELYIENPYDAEIQGKKGNFTHEQRSTDDIDLLLLFGIYPDVLNPVAKAESMELCEESAQTSATTERESSIPTQSSEIKPSKLFKIGTSHRFADVYFVTSKGKKVPSHRCILSEFSNIFTQIFEENPIIPVEIAVEDFDAETIQSALNFLLDKPDAINGQETELFEFAVKYGISSLIEACCSFFEEFVDPSSVCEYLQIAYAHNVEGLKQKCLKMLVQKKNEIDPKEIEGLPKNIIVDAFCR